MGLPPAIARRSRPDDTSAHADRQVSVSGGADTGLRGRTAPRSRAERPKPRCLRQVEDGWNTKPHEGGVCVGRNM